MLIFISCELALLSIHYFLVQINEGFQWNFYVCCNQDKYAIDESTEVRQREGETAGKENTIDIEYDNVTKYDHC